MLDSLDIFLQNRLQQFPLEDQPQVQSDINRLNEASIHTLQDAIRIAQDTYADTRVRAIACLALGQAKEKRAVTALLCALADENIDVYWEAAKALGNIQSKRAILPLIAVLRSGTTPDKRKAAAYTLSWLRDDRASAALLESLQSITEDPGVRGQAAEALAFMTKTDSVVDALITALVDPSAEVRFWSAYTLGELRIQEAVPALQQLVETDQHEIAGWGSICNEAASAIQRIQER